MTYRGILRCAVSLAGSLAVFACAPMTPSAQKPGTSPSGIVTPWNWDAPTSTATRAATPAGQDRQPASNTSQMAPAPHQTPSASGTTMSNQNRPAAAIDTRAQGAAAALTPAQRSEMDEARIALGILDRMANRCLTEANAAACTTFQVNWPNLSRQLRQSLSVISGTNFTDPVVPQTANSVSQPSSPVENVPRRASSSQPSMEKEIPLVPGN